jgi:hypothetical protein
MRCRFATSLEKSPSKIVPLGCQDEEEGFLARVDAGYKNGLRCGMLLYPRDRRVWAEAYVISVSQATASILVVYGGDGDPKVGVGSRLSTRSLPLLRPQPRRRRISSPRKTGASF